MNYITHWYYVFFLPLFLFGQVYGDEKYDLSDDLTLSAGLSFSTAFEVAGADFQYKRAPDQSQNYQPTSEVAHFPKYLSLHSSLISKNFGTLHARVDYQWNLPLHLGLYQSSQAVNRLLLRDLYVDIPLPTYGLNIWGGVRTFEFTAVTLFSLPNPFDQVALQGGGIGSENLQISFSLHAGHVNTIATNIVHTLDANGNLVESQQLVVDQNGNATQYGVNEYIATIFLSGKLLLAEGQLFEPIFAFRYYSGGNSKVHQPENTVVYRATRASALIAGGIFSRPISNGIAGTTTVWFSSLPSDAPVSQNAFPITNTYQGAGRVSPGTPMNTIGIIDSSEFYFLQESALFTAIYLTNNTYPKNSPVLKPASDGSHLEPDGQHTSNSNNRVSIGLQPVFFINQNLIGGVDFNANYVSEKLFYDEANSIVFSPLLKWAFDKKLNSTQYLLTSLSYGLYDWKVKRFSNNSQTNNLITMQVGVQTEF